MKITIAKDAGYCFGVRDAVDLAYETAKEYGEVYMLGDIVHNENVVKDLENLKGDWVHSYKTLPVVFGNTITKSIISALILITCLLIYLLIDYNLGLIKYYFIFCVPYMFLILVLTWISSSQKMYLWIHNFLKLIIIIGVFGIYFMYK